MSYRCTARLEKKGRIKRGEGLTRSEPDWFYDIDKKKPSQIEHRIGKSWIYVYHYLRVKWSNGKEDLVYFKDEEQQFLTEYKLKPDSYIVIDNAGGHRSYIFAEYQDVGNAWDKNYRPLFQYLTKDPAPNTSITLFVVLSEPSKNLEAKLKKEYSGFNIKLSIMTLNQLRDFIWRAVIKQREEKKEVI